ncbi:hypothetical protein LOAG_18014 [Loa loa]|uniref:Uncharacterized protein n=1 Tax=Loa loa TaxID=7209 RepID=A0A1S0UGY0_LOALO|nr:hypothetical protein LOAG_18014 [Loa loa]EJD74701.1 hypothetical protein LOAG_18014 [Loa loa]
MVTQNLKGVLEQLRCFSSLPTNPRYSKIKSLNILFKGKPPISRKRKSTVEEVERVFRELEAIGENLQHASIETAIESKLPGWLLEKVCQQKEENEQCSVTKPRQFLRNLVDRTDQPVMNRQLSSIRNRRNPIEYISNPTTKTETSALAAIKQSKGSLTLWLQFQRINLNKWI